MGKISIKPINENCYRFAPFRISFKLLGKVAVPITTEEENRHLEYWYTDRIEIAESLN